MTTVILADKPAGKKLPAPRISRRAAIVGAAVGVTALVASPAAPRTLTMGGQRSERDQATGQQLVAVLAQSKECPGFLTPAEYEMYMAAVRYWSGIYATADLWEVWGSAFATHEVRDEHLHKAVSLAYEAMAEKGDSFNESFVAHLKAQGVKDMPAHLRRAGFSEAQIAEVLV